MKRTPTAAERLEHYGLMEPWEISDGELSEWACEDCARYVAETENVPAGDSRASWYEGDGWNICPIWPYAESDVTASCAYCDAYLDTQLTTEGVEYLRAEYPAALWGYWGVE